MPNHVDNVLTVCGTAADVSAFRAAARGRPPKTGDLPGSPNHQDQEPDATDFNFHSLVPLPGEFSRVPYGDGGGRQGIDIECETWGLKWGAYGILPVIEDPRCLTYRFQTPWTAPHVFLGKVAKAWPALLFRLSYGGEGPCRGFGVWVGSDATFHDDEFRGERRWPDYPGKGEYDTDTEGGDRAYFDHADRATHKYRRDHVRRLALAESSLAEDVPDGVLADWLEEHAGWPLHAALLRKGEAWLDDRGGQP